MRDIRFPRQSPPETTVAEFQLHCFAESGNSYKPALYLALAGLDWEPIFVDYIVGGETRTDRYREDVNAMGESPVLTHRGRRISQSGAILTYLSDVTGHFAPAAEDRYEAMRWILFDNHKFTSYTATLRFMLNFAKTGETPVTEFLRARAKSAYAIVDKHLATRDFILGDKPTIADISLAGYVLYPEPTGLDPQDTPAIQAWKGRIQNLPGFVAPYDLLPRKAS
jgi:glutathione S-transferase